MPYIAYQPEKFLGKSVGTGHCAVFVEAAANVPRTDWWKQGEKVRSNFHIEKGTAIAVFQAGTYLNDTNGASHAAIYIDQTPEGIYVLDQWIHKKVRQVVHKRLIRFKSGIGKPVDDGDAYYIIEPHVPKKAKDTK